MEHRVLESNSEPFEQPVRIVASRKRRRTVSARMRAGVLELLVPASMPVAERQHWAEVMGRRLRGRADRGRPADERLMQRAVALNARHFDGRLRWKSIAFAEMRHQWGSCSFTEGTIRIARRAAAFPDWVIDYLLMHELAHLEHSDHGPAFHAMEERYPLAERARGYLLAMDERPPTP
ncbi:MAG TPA: M48 family metallopeptidase [Candidatus Dormibacteraeota bacterium]|nr:M48 family metallopeptidase [Candidatus Dormibacteraeota bacterium]